MRVTEKGQVTIPKPIRDKLGIVPGSEVEFLERGEVVELVRSDPERRASAVRRALEAMRGTLDLGGLTTDEYMELVRGPRDDLDPR